MSGHNLKVSLITTVKNEEKTILMWLRSLAYQTRLPDEVIIVDGGSDDKTVDIIRAYLRQSKLNIKFFIVPGANIAKGRNVAIKNASFEIIACTDAGCILHPQWLENIIKPFENDPNIDVVSGVYLPWYESEFEEIASYLIFPDIDKLDVNSFLPSSRSIAFKKIAWEEVGGYPEWLDTAEDTLFDLNLKKAGKRFYLEKNAIVYWKVREDLGKIFRQFFNYAKGDGLAFLFPQRYLPRYFVLFLTALLLFYFGSNLVVLLSIGMFYLLGLYFKYIRKIRKPSFKRIFIALQISLVIELAIITGYLFGIFKRLKKEIIIGNVY
jgi:cellulose synthase/poly-beta-1,6-N-acetylglucosamine synthase-like glycosyltransferase